MSIEYYNEGPCFNIESQSELVEALDILHTQVMDNCDEEPEMLAVLSEAMDKLNSNGR